MLTDDARSEFRFITQWMVCRWAIPRSHHSECRSKIEISYHMPIVLMDEIVSNRHRSYKPQRLHLPSHRPEWRKARINTLHLLTVSVTRRATDRIGRMEPSREHSLEATLYPSLKKDEVGTKGHSGVIPPSLPRSKQSNHGSSRS